MLGRKYIQFINNIALVAVLFTALSPALSQAFTSSDGAPKPFTVEVCSADGKKLVEADIVGSNTENQSQAPAQRNVRLHAVHGALCVDHNSALTTPLADTSLFLTDAAHQVVAFYTPPIAQCFFQSANLAQAPPLL